MLGADLRPVSGRARIEVLDILRGLAILGIFFMNAPFMGMSVMKAMHDVRLTGWTVFDRDCWIVVQIALEGTQRCTLEFLFGAGMMVLAARAMAPDGPVAVADLYLRRTYWLMLFGLIDIFALLWVGDILLIYALAALFLFPFRRLGPKTLVALGSLFALFTLASGASDYSDRVALTARHQAVAAKIAAHQPLSADEKKAQADWQKLQEKLTVTPKLNQQIAEEAKGHAGGVLPYAQWYWAGWVQYMWQGGGTLMGVFEAFCAMLLGVALWKWGVIQGDRGARFYGAAMLVAYAVGITIRSIGVAEQLAFNLAPKTIWATAEIGRLAMGFGHVCLINLLVKSVAGRRLLAPFKAAGRMAFSLYFLEQIVGLWVLFAPWGPGLWGRYSWGGITVIAAILFVANTIVANLWMRAFVNGPMEWAWRSLAYLKWQPFRRRRNVTPLTAEQAAPLAA